MRIFFSSLPNKETIDKLLELECYSFLFSFENKKKCLDQVKYLATITDKPIVVIIDSGAFSVWNRGMKLDKQHYLEFIRKMKAEIPFSHKLYFMNVDVIPHTKGTVPTQEQIDKACIEGIENYHWFKERGELTVHTYHQFESKEMLERILTECNDLGLIGVSPANDQSSEERIAFLREAFSVIKTRTKVHILGFTAKEALEVVPAYSSDSSTWLNPSKYGETFDWRKMLKISKQALSPNELLYYKKDGSVINAFRYFARLQKHTTKLWKQRNIEWTD